MNSTTTNSSLTNDLPRCQHRAVMPETSLLRYTNSLAMTTTSTIDLHWTGRPRSIAAVLLESDGHRALLDPGPSSTLSTLREQLRARGLSVNDLEAIFLTHIHLDHAGATGSLIRENPR